MFKWTIDSTVFPCAFTSTIIRTNDCHVIVHNINSLWILNGHLRNRLDEHLKGLGWSWPGYKRLAWNLKVKTSNINSAQTPQRYLNAHKYTEISSADNSCINITKGGTLSRTSGKTQLLTCFILNMDCRGGCTKSKPGDTMCVSWQIRQVQHQAIVCVPLLSPWLSMATKAPVKSKVCLPFSSRKLDDEQLQNNITKIESLAV